MKNVATQSSMLAGSNESEEPRCQEASSGCAHNRSTPIDARLLASYLDALRRGVLLSG